MYVGLFFLGAILVFCLHAWLGGTERYRFRFDFDSGRYIHIHHWIIYTVLLVLLVIFRNKVPDPLEWFLAGCCLGGFIHGFLYFDNRFDIIG
jgi:hypothetical protein